MATEQPTEALGEAPKLPQLALDAILIGVDLGSTSIRTGAVGSAGKLLDFRLEPESDRTAPTRGREIADHLLSAVERMIEAHSRSGRLAAIGVGLPGLVDHSNHRIINLPNAQGLVGLDLYGEFEAKFGVPIYFDNNANAAAYAEMTCGIARGESDWLYLHIGGGIGAGLVLDGKLRRGKSGFAGEIGHVNVDPEGSECPCGSFGCLETVASASNIVRRTRDRLRRDATSSLSRLGAMGGFTYDDIIAAAESGDDLAKMMLERTGIFIGRALAGVINLLNLSMVAIGGAPSARPFLVPAIIEETRRRAFAPVFRDCRIVAAELGSEAGVVGAALLAAKQIN